MHMLPALFTAGPDGTGIETLLWQTRPASVEPTVLGVYTSLLVSFTRPSRRQAVNGEARLGFHEVSSLNVSRIAKNCVSIVHDVRSLGEQGVDVAVRLICFSSI